MTGSASPISSARSRSAPGSCWTRRSPAPPKVDPQINAVVVKHLRLCRTANRQRASDGPFTGVPFLLKDLELLEGTRTTSGASVYKDNIADHTGTLAQRFLDAGVTIFGKSSSPEFGLLPTTESRLFGPTRNPWNLAHSSGGSSGGAAAAVAARILPVAHASDGGGSIRIPASASGVFGLKPTRARNPLGPDRGEGWGGFSVRPCRQHQRARQRGDAGRDPWAGTVEPLCRAAAGAALSPRRSDAIPAGCASPLPTGRPMAMPSIPRSRQRFATSPACWPGSVIMSRNARRTRRRSGGRDGDHRRRQHRAERAARRAALWPRNDGQRLRGPDACERPQRAKDECDRLCGRAARRVPDFARARRRSSQTCDVFLCPTLCSPPLRIGELNPMSEDLSHIAPILRRYMPGTSMFNMSGQPAMSVPLAWNRAGLPLGMMFSARFGDEATLFRLAAQLEQERPWRDKLPPVCA